jgi:SAM-dependent methyltransferase
VSGERALPSVFVSRLRELARSYLASEDPCQQSGFGGGAERWRAEREPILEGVAKDGDFIDLGCANGFLLECLRGWAAAKEIRLDPFGLDQSAELVALARERLPELASHFFVGNSWSWEPPRRFDYVYSLADAVPASYLRDHIQRLHSSFVAPGGRLILGSYGSRSRQLAPVDVGGALEDAGYAPMGSASAGNGPLVRFAWVEKCAA